MVEVRRIKARVDVERLPRGADRQTHLKLGRGGLADVEWTVQLLQMRHAGRVEALRTPQTLPALEAATAAGLIAEDDAGTLAEAWRLVSEYATRSPSCAAARPTSCRATHVSGRRWRGCWATRKAPRTRWSMTTSAPPVGRTPWSNGSSGNECSDFIPSERRYALHMDEVKEKASVTVIGDLVGSRRRRRPRRGARAVREGDRRDQRGVQPPGAAAHRPRRRVPGHLRHPRRGDRSDAAAPDGAAARRRRTPGHRLGAGAGAVGGAARRGRSRLVGRAGRDRDRRGVPAQGAAARGADGVRRSGGRAGARAGAGERGPHVAGRRSSPACRSDRCRCSMV